MPKRRRMRLYCPYSHPWEALRHPMAPIGPPRGFGWGRPTLEEEKEHLDEYIEMLKEELADAKEYRKELEETQK